MRQAGERGAGTVMIESGKSGNPRSHVGRISTIVSADRLAGDTDYEIITYDISADENEWPVQQSGSGHIGDIIVSGRFFDGCKSCRSGRFGSQSRDKE